MTAGAMGGHAINCWRGARPFFCNKGLTTSAPSSASSSVSFYPYHKYQHGRRIDGDTNATTCLARAARGGNRRTGHFPRHHSHSHPGPGHHHHTPITSSVLVVGIDCRLPNGAVQGPGVAHSVPSCSAFVFVSALLLRP